MDRLLFRACRVAVFSQSDLTLLVPRGMMALLVFSWNGGNPMFGLRGIGIPELLIVLVIVVLIFGTSKLSGVGGALGSSIREFRKAMTDDEDAKPKPAPESESESESESKEIAKP